MARKRLILVDGEAHRFAARIGGPAHMAASVTGAPSRSTGVSYLVLRCSDQALGEVVRR